MSFEAFLQRMEKPKLTLLKCLGLHLKRSMEEWQKGVFGSDEIQTMIDEFHIEDPAAIFFARE